MKGVIVMDQLLMYASNYGFPMVVAGFLLVRIEAKLDKLDDSIQLLLRAVEKHI